MHLKNQNLLRDAAYINGKWEYGNNEIFFQVNNPATCEVITKLPDLSVADVSKVIDAAYTAFYDWRNVNAYKKCQLLKAWSDKIRENVGDLAVILTNEQGKPLKEAKGEILGAADGLEWAAEEAKRICGEILPAYLDGVHAMVIKQPVGVIAAITAWNYPIGNVLHKCSSALAAGCCVVLKPSASTPLSVLSLAYLAEKVGIPPGVFNVITSNDPVVIGKEFTANPKIKHLSFTGSIKVGKLLMQQSASTVKKLTLELGGNAPFIVFDDAKIDSVVKDLIERKFTNAGQICIAANRIFLHEKIHDDFVDELVAEVNKLKVGNGLEADTNIGPVINSEAAQKIKKLMDDAVQKGAKVVCGGKSLGDAFFEPTLLVDVMPDMLIARHEIFGPVAAVQKFSSEQEVITKANDTNYGLASYFYTQDVNRIFRLSDQLEYGVVSVNGISTASPSIPFGGIKESGLGKEGGKYGVEDFCEIKYISVKEC